MASEDSVEPDRRAEGDTEAPQKRVLTPAAQRALAEAEERRRNSKAIDRPPELNGREGPDPVRYGDWEKKGLISDF